ncbi:UPF0182 family protein [Clostridium guangxiense]|uniref:UPF0182 family protein n=1 Tax=Clostridium guangxiense TaxID=1662055 RepID=UPI001E4EFC61|nr:UPF0182 family protein [Clostridium guangxiense]MCD2348952.1 UPF0182 family protein [Clostridium guangxiense]
MKKGIRRAIILALIFIVIAFFGRLTSFIINIEWFNEVGYLSVYFTKIVAVLILMIPLFAIIYLMIWLYYKSIRKSIIKWNKAIEVDVKKEKLQKRIFFIADLVLSLLFSYSFADAYWYKILQFMKSSAFNTKDPIFGIDVSFYVFKLPLIESLYGIIMFLLAFLFVLTLIIYILFNIRDYANIRNRAINVFSVRSFGKGLVRFAGKLLATLSSLIIFLLSFGYLIRAWNLVYSPRGVVYGAGYTDMHVSLIFYGIIITFSIIAGIVIFLSVIKSKVRPIIISICIIIILVIAEGVTSPIVQRLLVNSNEKTKEAPYIRYNIDYTRKAFNVDKVEEKEFPANEDLTVNDIKDNRPTIDNIKVNSYDPSLEFYNQVQVIRYYYDFNDIDVDRYNINGKYNQVFIAPREIDTKSLQGNADTWQNRHLVYTHGYGTVISKVNSITDSGQPDFVMKDIPPVNSTKIKFTDPRIYFGEETNDYAIGNNTLGEFDYPNGSVNKTNNYDGKGGIKATLINRCLFAINKHDVNFLLSGNINSNSKILINRNITERVKKIAPFLTYDKDPYAVISGGKIYWIIDAYTTSDRYPYSQPVDNVNYIRNSIKVVVDAVDGITNFYIIDNNDPIANSYSKIFPGLFKSSSEVPTDIRKHFKYPEDLFRIQSSVLEKYHVTDTGIFYNGEDLWDVSKNMNDVEGEKSVSDSSYMVMRLPNENKEEMVLMQYFNMRSKNNMVALLGARMDESNYGKMILYKLPTDKTIDSPYLFNQKFRQDPAISKEISLWNTQGSKVQFGDTSVIPINKSLIYIVPVYIRAQGKNSIPEVKRVIVAYGSKVVMAENVDKALGQIFNYADNQNDNSENQTQGKNNNTKAENNIDKEKLKAAQELYNNAIDAQKDGDWSKYGEYIKELGKTIEELNK